MRVRRETLCAVAVVLMGCGGGEVDDGTYVARLSTSDAWVSVEVRDQSAVAYVCGGSQSLETETRWMHGTANGDELRFERDGWVLELREEGEILAGVLVDPDGGRTTVDADALDDSVTPDERLTGLFTAVVDGCRSGVIIDRNGDAQGAFCTELGFMSQVTPVQPVVRTPDGIAVEAQGPEGLRSFFVNAVDLPSVLAELEAEGG
jgi:hypothetical protein